MNRAGWILTAFAATAISMQAHPGHAPLSNGVAHFLTSPVHFLPLLILSVVLAAGAQFLKSPKYRRALRVSSAVMAVVAVASLMV